MIFLVFQVMMSLATITGVLKVIFKKYEKILHTRSDLICFDDIFDQTESSISNNIVKNFFRQPLHYLSSVAFIISTFGHLTHCTLTNTNVVRVRMVFSSNFYFLPSQNCFLI